MVKELASGPKTIKWPSWASNPGTQVSITLHKHTLKKGSSVNTELGARSLNSATQ